MSLDTEGKVILDKSFYGKKSAILGQSGSGKSYAARVIIEEGKKLSIPMVVFDPQDAHRNYPDFEYINGKAIKNAKKLGKLVAATSKSVVIILKGLTIEDQQKTVKEFLTGYRLAARKGIQTIVIDEAHKFAPESEKTSSKDEVRGMAQENRSDGIGLLVLTQRPQRLDKTILSQCDTIIAGRVTSFRDKDSIKNYLENPDDAQKLSRLETGSFYYFDGGQEPTLLQVRKAETTHTGDAPTTILSENSKAYSKYASKVVHTKGKQMSENASQDLVKNVIPSTGTFLDLAKMGMTFAAGSAVGGLVSSAVSSRVSLAIGGVSTRTVASAGSTIALYAGYRLASRKNMELAAKLLNYGAAGSAAFTIGSAVYDGLRMAGIQIPAVGAFILNTATGVSPMNQEKIPDAGQGDGQADLNTAFA